MSLILISIARIIVLDISEMRDSHQIRPSVNMHYIELKVMVER